MQTDPIQGGTPLNEERSALPDTTPSTQGCPFFAGQAGSMPLQDFGSAASAAQASHASESAITQSSTSAPLAPSASLDASVPARIRLEAYVVSSTDGWTLEPAPARREWMDQTTEKFAYRCLPLVMANQAGWILTCPLNFSAIWSGRGDRHGTTITFPEGEGRNKNQIRSHFGHGIVTFSLPWLFRTDKGFGLWARGPANYVKDNLSPLDGIVETDWAPYTFTMNWKIQRRDTEVFFRKGEPICQILPFHLNMLEAVEPEFKELRDNPEFAADFQDFVKRRDANLNKLAQTHQSSFQMDYMRGHRPDGSPVSEHRKAFKLNPFKKRG